ncbi:hypothetical protein [Protofrankia symbiont of Coriaria ruscifolia]|uniref:hypothetical protein n=1 Tax=Protofrankia symbiont of Coriaria ruscifolia TaxID=1306542 RepID=UPI0013EF771E|nr:hypothetical protein [Protofrankia symbiont of Coriaria ruscifolia]
MTEAGATGDVAGPSTTVLFDVLAEVEGQLRACYLERFRDDRNPADERAAWWDKVTGLRDEFQQVGHDDRGRITDLLDQWRQELTLLRDDR